MQRLPTPTKVDGRWDPELPVQRFFLSGEHRAFNIIDAQQIFINVLGKKNMHGTQFMTELS